MTEQEMNKLTMAALVAEINKLAKVPVKATTFKTKALAIKRLKEVAGCEAPKPVSLASAWPFKDVPAATATAAKPKKAAKPKAAAKPKKAAVKKAEKKAKVEKKVAKKEEKAVANGKVPLIATPDEVKELQAIRDLRLAGKGYKDKKTSFFKKFRAKYGIKGDGRIKVETEDAATLGLTQHCSNNAKVMVDAAA